MKYHLNIHKHTLAFVIAALSRIFERSPSQAREAAMISKEILLHIDKKE